MKLVVVGQDKDRLGVIKEELKNLMIEGRKVNVTTAHPNYLEGVLDSNTKVFILDANEINKMAFPMVHQIRNFGFMGPILMLAHLPLNFELNEIAQVDSFYFLKKPYQPEQLIGVVKNCINIQNMRQRRDQRFDVHEQATLQAYSSDFKTETIINNISKSGVRIEGKLSGIKKGDLMRLHFNFDQIKKERVMSARVVWLKKEDDNSEQAGLEFVSQKVVYKYLLDYAVA